MPLRDKDILNLPEAPDFISQPPQFTLAEMIALSERLLPYWNTQRYSRPEPKFVGESFSLIEARDNPCHDKKDGPLS